VTRGVYQRLGGCRVHARQDHRQSSRQVVDASHQAKIDLGVNRCFRRKRDLLLAGNQLDRRKEAGRPPGRE
jgi:hypothetical protein